MAVKWVEYALGKNINTVLSERNLTRNTNAFTDTSNSDILAAFALGITNGTSATTFTPNGQFTREQAATMIANTCKAIGANVSNPPSSGFADLNSAAGWARDGINFVRANGIMQGTGNNNFSPKTAYTREQSIITFNNINHTALPKQATPAPAPPPPPAPTPTPPPAPAPAPTLPAGDHYPGFPSVPDFGTFAGIRLDRKGTNNDYWYRDCNMTLFNNYTALLVSRGFVNSYSSSDGTYKDYTRDGITVNVFFGSATNSICVEIK